MKRSRVQIIHDILSVIHAKGGAIKPTHLLYKANLSHESMKQYVGELCAGGFMEERTERAGKRFALTDKGYKFLSEYKRFSAFAESFGIK